MAATERKKAGRPSSERAVRNWRLHNPTGKKVQCARELSLSRVTVAKHWLAIGEGDRRSCSEKVKEWRKDNPDGRICDCVRALQISRRSVNYHWHDLEEEERIASLPPDIDKDGQYLLF